MLETPLIAQLTRLVNALSSGDISEVEKLKSTLPTLTSDNELTNLQDSIINLTQKYTEANTFINNLSAGNLTVDAPRKNRLVDQFKELQANLRHLVWQTQEIAKGDYDQHVDFLGDFSVSFNSLVTALKEKKKIEEALTKSEEQYRDIFEHSIEGIYQSSFEGKLQRINPTFARLFGYESPEEMIRSVENVAEQLYYYPEDRKILLDKLMHDGFAKDLELRFKNRNGSMFWVSSNSRIVKDSNGNALYLEGTFVDITKRKLSEELTKLNEARLKRAELTANVGNWELHIESNVIIASDGAKAIYELNLDQEEYSYVKTLPLPEYRQKLDKALNKLLHENIPYDIEFKIKARKTGKIKDIHSQAFYDKNKKIVFGIIQDITQRKQIEEALRASESRLLELNATKDKFFSIIAHDLKSPFNSILGLSSLLEEQIKENNFDGIEEFASLIHSSSELAYDLLKNLLDWSRSQTGKIEFSPEYIELVALINDAISILSNGANQKSINIYSRLPKNLIVFADKSMISTVLRNIISNAIKFSKPDGQIIISHEKNKADIEITISDSGVGIKKEDLNKLFKIDENHSTLGTYNEKGTGLGLILCKEFIEKHGGKIWVESELGVGSKFHFSIPKN